MFSLQNEYMKDNFLIKIETWHKPDMGHLENVIINGNNDLWCYMQQVECPYFEWKQCRWHKCGWVFFYKMFNLSMVRFIVYFPLLVVVFSVV